MPVHVCEFLDEISGPKLVILDNLVRLVHCLNHGSITIVHDGLELSLIWLLLLLLQTIRVLIFSFVFSGTCFERRES